jgi:hypothetical protein
VSGPRLVKDFWNVWPGFMSRMRPEQLGAHWTIRLTLEAVGAYSGRTGCVNGLTALIGLADASFLPLLCFLFDFFVGI